MPLPEGYEQWTCDNCLASCTFEAMNWCHRRWDPSSRCAHERDKPLACHPADTGRAPDQEGAFEFVQLRTK